MTSSHGQLKNDGLVEDNCRIDQLTGVFLDNFSLSGDHHSCRREAAKFAEMLVLNELIFGSPNHAIQELIENRALLKTRQGRTG